MPPALGVAAPASLRARPVGSASGAWSSACSGASRASGLSGRACRAGATPGGPGLSGMLALPAGLVLLPAGLGPGREF